MKCNPQPRKDAASTCIRSWSYITAATRCSPYSQTTQTALVSLSRTSSVYIFTSVDPHALSSVNCSSSSIKNLLLVASTMMISSDLWICIFWWVQKVQNHRCKESLSPSFITASRSRSPSHFYLQIPWGPPHLGIVSQTIETVSCTLVMGRHTARISAAGGMFLCTETWLNEIHLTPPTYIHYVMLCVLVLGPLGFSQPWQTFTSLVLNSRPKLESSPLGLPAEYTVRLARRNRNQALCSVYGSSLLLRSFFYQLSVQ